MTFLAKLLISAYYGAKSGNAAANKQIKNHKRVQKARTLLRSMPVRDSMLLYSLIMMDDPDPIIDQMPAEEIEHLYDVIACFKMELEEDFRN